MPIAMNPKINNMVDTTITMDNQTKHQRDMSVDEAPHSRLSELNRGSQI